MFDEFYPDGWNHDDVERAANNRYGGKVTAVHPAPVGAEPRETRSSGGGSAPSGGGGCGTVIGLLLLAVVVGAFGGSGDDKPSAPSESPVAPQSRVAEPYASPPPSYCVTENFEPC